MKKLLILLFSCAIILLAGCADRYSQMKNVKYTGYQNEQSHGRYRTTVDLIFESGNNTFILRGDIRDKDLLVKESVYNISYSKTSQTLERYTPVLGKKEEK